MVNGDMETSSTLAAEADNAFTSQKDKISKLKLEIHDITLKSSKLVQQMFSQGNSLRLKYELEIYWEGHSSKSNHSHYRSFKWGRVTANQRDATSIWT